MHSFTRQQACKALLITAGLALAPLASAITFTDVYVPVENMIGDAPGDYKAAFRVAELQGQITSQVNEKVTAQQREFFLREQLKIIQKELNALNICLKVWLKSEHMVQVYP